METLAQLAGLLSRAARLTDTAARWLASQALRPVLVDGHLPVDVGRTIRTVPIWLRSLLTARTAAAAGPAAPRPPSAFHAYHLVH